jgi:hypothetical protein
MTGVLVQRVFSDEFKRNRVPSERRSITQLVRNRQPLPGGIVDLAGS